MSEPDDAFQMFRIIVAATFTVCSLLIVAVWLFPSMRGSKWVDQDLWLAVIFALLAVAWRPR